MCSRACARLFAAWNCCGLNAHADIGLSPRNLGDNGDPCFRELVSLSLAPRAAVWTVGTGYNCIVLPSHSVSTPICLFNIQLSALDLEASMTAQSHIHTNTSMADFSWGPLKMMEREDRKDRKKKWGAEKTRCENAVTETKVNKTTWWIDPACIIKRKAEWIGQRDAFKVSGESTRFGADLILQKVGRVDSSTKCYFQKKTCKISWESGNQKIRDSPPGVPLYTPRKGSFLKLRLWAVIMNIWAHSSSV